MRSSRAEVAERPPGGGLPQPVPGREPRRALELPVMKSREPLIRAKRFKVDDARRRAAQIETIIAEFDRMVLDLDRDIAAEEARSGLSDPKHFAYPPLALAARQRRENLRRSADDLSSQREQARAALAEAEADLALAEAAGARERVEETPARRQVWRENDAARL